MTDVLDINSSVDFEVDEEGDQGVARLKDKARKRKGRGFGGPESKQTESKAEKTRYEAAEVEEREEPAVAPQKSIEGWILFVTSVHEEASEEDVYEKFSEFGTIKNINMNLDRRTGFLKGYALIEYEGYDEANNARETLDGSELLGQAIGVNWSFVKGPRKTMRRTQRHRRQEEWHSDRE